MNDSTETIVPVTRIQKLIGSLMQQSKLTKPCCYMETSADITDLVKLRKRFSKDSGVRVTTNDFFVHAIACAIKKYPLLAGTLDDSGEKIHVAEKFGVGLAVAAPQGLVVPVIHDTADMSLVDVALKSDDLVKKARANKLHLDDFDGANIVLSGLGMFGVSSFLAITPPDAAGIISIGKFENKVMPVEGKAVVRRMMSVAFSVDQRLVDEFYAAKFFGYLIEQLENPETLID